MLLIKFDSRWLQGYKVYVSAKFDSTSPQSILEFAKWLIWKNISSFLPGWYKVRWGKWSLGQLIEEHYFKKPLDSLSWPDFPGAWVELKATPIKSFSRKWIWAKERLVLNIINYDELVKEEYEKSGFINKNALILIIFYFYKKWELNINHIIKIVELFSFLDYPEDAKIIRNDWHKIQEKILEWNAHNISEWDTEYLWACTKWSKNQKLRRQPFSDIPAKQRAFTFKQGYVNFILKKIQGKTTDYDSLFSWDLQQNEDFSIELLVKSLFSPYIGKTAFDLGNLFDLDFKNQKWYYATLSDEILKRILNVRNLNKVVEFEKANICLKTIRVSLDWKLQEDISFPKFKFTELIKEKWSNSELRDMLESTKFLFIKFKILTNTVAEFKRLDDAEKNKFLILDSIHFWNAPIRDIENYAKPTWIDTVNTIKKWVIITPLLQKWWKIIDKNNLPNSKDTKMIHVRPHWANKKDVDILPDWRELTKQCFWFNKAYIMDQLNL